MSGSLKKFLGTRYVVLEREFADLESECDVHSERRRERAAERAHAAALSAEVV